MIEQEYKVLKAMTKDSWHGDYSPIIIHQLTSQGHLKEHKMIENKRFYTVTDSGLKAIENYEEKHF